MRTHSRYLFGASGAQSPANRIPRRIAIIAVATTSAFLVCAVGPALAGGGVIGNPQPELAQFTVSATSDGPGGGAVLSNGDVLFAWQSSSTSMRTCLLHPGGRSCASSATLAGDGGSNLYGPPLVIATGGNDVSVIVTDITDNISYNSTDGGHTFSAPVQVGSLYATSAGVDAAGHVVVAGIDPHQGFVIQQVSTAGPVNPSSAVLTAGAGCNYDPSVSTYAGGVLVACDDLTSTHVWFAASGKDFSSTTSYKQVAVISGQQAVDLSGGALLTVPSNSITSGGTISFFNGTSFGPARKVPDTKLGDDGYWAMQETGASAHVFFEGRRNQYDLFEESTSDGAHWSGQSMYGSAIHSNDLVPVLGPTGAGQLFEADGNPQLSQPILNAQSVHISFVHPRVKVGVRGIIKGQAGPRLANQLVTLDRLISSKWYPVASTRESASGSFSFSVAGSTATYRAVVNYKPGYYQYGYSNAATLTAVR